MDKPDFNELAREATGFSVGTFEHAVCRDGMEKIWDDYVTPLQSRIQELEKSLTSLEMATVKMSQFIPVDDRELFLKTLNTSELNRLEVAEIVAMIKGKYLSVTR